MKNIKRIISVLISASMLISCINVFAEEPDLVEQLSSKNSAVELSDAISELTSAQLTELGIDITEYNRLTYPEFVAEEILLHGFSSNEEFKAAFDTAMDGAVSEKNIVATYGAAVRTATTNADDGTKPGVTFGNQMTNRNAETYIGFDIPNSSEVMDITMSIRYSTSDFTQSQRSAVLAAYSFEQYPPAPKTDSTYKQGSNYDQSTELYAEWAEFIGKSTVVASSNIRGWTIKKGANPPIAINTINSEIITALNEKIKNAEDKTSTTPLNVKMGPGDNMYIVSMLGNTSATGNANNPHLIVKYDNTKIWHDNYYTTVADGETGVYNLEEISVEYGTEIEGGTWVEDNIQLINTETNDTVDISVNANNVITLEEALADETSYILTIKNITDGDGNPLKDRRIYFTTAGIYKSIYFETKQELEIDETVDFKVRGKMTKREVEVTNEADITISDNTAIEYNDGTVTALDYGYSEITAKILNVDSTEVTNDTYVLVPAVKTAYTAEDEIGELAYSKFAVSVDFTDDLSVKEENGFGFEGAVIGLGETYYTLNSADLEIERADGEHQVMFIGDLGNMSVYLDGVKVYSGTAGTVFTKTADYITAVNVMRLCDTKPVINDLSVTGMSEGDAVIGDTLTVSYEIFDADGDEATADGAWYIADTADGTYTKLSTDTSITVTNEQVSKYIRYIITPKNDIGIGEEYKTEPIKVSLGYTLEKILSDIQNTDALTVREVIEANADIIGVDLKQVNKLAQPDYVYGELANTSFASIDEIVSKFEEALNKYLVTEKKSVKAFHSYSTADGMYIDDTNEQRRQLFKYDAYITTDGFTNVDAIIGVDLTLFVGGDHTGYPNAYFVNEPWDYTNLDLLTEKFAKVTGTPGMSSFPYGNKYTTRAVSQEVLDSLTEGCALTIRLQNTGNCTVYSNGATAANRPYYTVTYDKTALMQKEATFDIANGQQEVAHDLSAVNIDFFKAVDESTVNDTNITLVKDSDGTPVDVTVSKTADGKFTVSIPENSLEPETTYRLDMKNITDTDGNALSDQVVRFTTETIIKNLSVVTKTSYAIDETSSTLVNGLTINGSIKRMSGITFTSSDPAVATVNSNGTITAIKRGTATITASYKNYDDTVVSRKVIVNVYNHNTGESFETNVNAKNDYSYAGMMSLPVDGDTTLYTSEYNNYAEVNYYDNGTNADASISFGGKTVELTSSANSTGWHQIVFDNREDKMKVYVDGELSDEVTFSGDNAMKASGTGIYVDNVNINDISGTVCAVQNVAVRGSVTVGGKLSANYGYIDPDDDKEDGTIIKWYTSSSQNGSYKLVEESAAYTTKSAGYVKVGVTPKNMYETGEEVLSPAFAVGKNTNASGGGGGTGSSGGGNVSQIATSNDSNLEANKNKSFTDVTGSHWAYEAIMDMKNAGIVNGVSEQTFNPDGLVTRAQFAAMLVRALDKNEAEYSDSFTDVNANDWYAGAVQAAFDEGLINGFDGKFAPNDNITREQMVKMVVCAYQKLNTSFKLGEYDITFDDMEEAGDWSRQYIQAACSLKIVSGVGDNRFAPKDNATRAQAAVMINNMLK